MRTTDARLDVSARAGVVLAAAAAGASTQPNLLTRGTPDQALITGVAAAAAYGWGVSGHSMLRSVADRVPAHPALSGLAVDGAAAALGLAGMRAFRPRGADPWQRSLARLAAMGSTAVGLAGIKADVLQRIPGRFGRGLTAAAAVTAGVSAWSLTRGGRAAVGSRLADGTFFEDTPRTISPAKTAGLGIGIGGLLYGLSHGEAALSAGLARVAARILGGTPQDHRTLGRLAATSASYGVGWLGMPCSQHGSPRRAAGSSPPTRACRTSPRSRAVPAPRSRGSGSLGRGRAGWVRCCSPITSPT